MREVEAEIVGRNQAALLRDMRAEVPPKRGMKQVRRAVVGADAVAALAVDLLVNGLADRQLARRRPSCASTWSLPSGFDVSSTSPTKPLSVVSFPVSPIWPPLSP